MGLFGKVWKWIVKVAKAIVAIDAIFGRRRRAFA